jgi:cobalt-zinc-cadmium efflux system outer membrane protein
MKASVRIVLACVVASFASVASAQDAVDVSLEELYAMADTSPRIVAAETLADADLGDVTIAGTPENPVLSYDIWGLIWGQQTNGGSQQQVTLSQTFPWPGQLEARVQAARAQHASDLALVDLARALLRLEVRRAFVALLAAQERESLLASQEAVLEGTASIVRGRAEAGAGRRWDILRMDAELASIRAERDAATADTTVAAGRIATLLGRPDWTPRARGTWADLPAPALRDGDAPLDEHPAIEAARRATEAAEAALRREHALVIPAFQLRIGTMVSTWPEGGYLYGGIAMPLPIFDQNQGAIDRAEREAEAARERETATRAELAATLRSARAALEGRRQALADFDTGVVERLPQISEMAGVAYRGGEIGVFELLDAVRSTRALVLERVEREAELHDAEVDWLEAALGTPPP